MPKIYPVSELKNPPEENTEARINYLISLPAYSLIITPI